jgi:hypothetical protein
MNRLLFYSIIFFTLNTLSIINAGENIGSSLKQLEHVGQELKTLTTEIQEVTHSLQPVIQQVVKHTKEITSKQIDKTIIKIDESGRRE